MSRPYITPLLLGLLLVALAGARVGWAQERTASERYANAIRKSSGLTPSACQAIEVALNGGWPAGDAAAALSALLHANAASLAELRRGGALPSCVLYPGTNVFDRTADDVFLLVALTRLCGVDALRAVSLGLETRAVRDVETVLGVGRHAAADRALEVRLQGLALVRLGCRLAERLRTRAAREVVLKALPGVVLPSTREVATIEKGVYLDGVDHASRDLPWLRASLLAMAPRVAAAYYDPLIATCGGGGVKGSAADGRSPGAPEPGPADTAASPDENGADDHDVRALAARMKQTYGDLPMPQVAERAKAAGLRGDALAEELCRCIVCRVWPDLAGYTRSLDETKVALDALRARLAPSAGDKP